MVRLISVVAMVVCLSACEVCAYHYTFVCTYNGQETIRYSSLNQPHMKIRDKITVWHLGSAGYEPRQGEFCQFTSEWKKVSK